MIRKVCGCLQDAVLCEACGTLCLWFEIPERGRVRFHLVDHVPGPAAGILRAVFHPHGFEHCAVVRAQALGSTVQIGSF